MNFAWRIASANVVAQHCARGVDVGCGVAVDVVTIGSWELEFGICSVGVGIGVTGMMRIVLSPKNCAMALRASGNASSKAIANTSAMTNDHARRWRVPNKDAHHETRGVVGVGAGNAFSCVCRRAARGGVGG